MSPRGAWQRGDRVRHRGASATVSSVYDAGVVIEYDDGRARMIRARDLCELLPLREDNPQPMVYYRGVAYPLVREIGASVWILRDGVITSVPAAAVSTAPTAAPAPKPSLEGPPRVERRPPQASPAVGKSVFHRGAAHPVLREDRDSFWVMRQGQFVESRSLRGW